MRGRAVPSLFVNHLFLFPLSLPLLTLHFGVICTSSNVTASPFQSNSGRRQQSHHLRVLSRLLATQGCIDHILPIFFFFCFAFFFAACIVLVLIRRGGGGGRNVGVLSHDSLQDVVRQKRAVVIAIGDGQPTIPVRNSVVIVVVIPLRGGIGREREAAFRSLLLPC